MLQCSDVLSNPKPLYMQMYVVVGGDIGKMRKVMVRVEQFWFTRHWHLASEHPVIRNAHGAPNFFLDASSGPRGPVTIRVFSVIACKASVKFLVMAL